MTVAAMPAIASGVGAATQVGQAIGSGIKGNRAANEANRRITQTDQIFNQSLDQGMRMLDVLRGMGSSFADPRMPQTDGLVQAQGGPRSRRGGPTLSQTILNDAVQGGQNLSGVFTDTADQLGNRDLANQAADIFGQQGGFDQIMSNLNSMGGLQSFNPASIYEGTAFTPSQMQQTAFDFAPVNQVRDQAIQGAIDAGDRARATAQEQAALGLQQTQSGIGAALADMGLSRNAGAGAAALADFGTQTGQQLTQLNRDIANQTQAAALQGAQFDVNSLLNLTGMGSQYDLGFNQLQAGRESDLNNLLGTLGMSRDQMIANQMMNNAQLGAQFGMSQNALLGDLAGQGLQYDINRAQGLAGLQQMQDATTLAQGDLRGRAITDPLSILQGVYQENYLAPQMQMAGLQSNILQTLLTGAMGGLMQNSEAAQKAAASAGSGKGAATGGATSSLSNFGNSFSNKGARTGASGPGPMPGFGVGF